MDDLGYKDRLRDFLESGTREAKVAKLLLCILALASIPIVIIGAGAIGNAVQVFKTFETSKRYSKNQIKSAMQSAKRQKLIKYVTDKNGQTVIKITQKGKIKLRAFTIDDLVKIKKPKKWDKKWRLVMYDFPLRFKKAREGFRWKLKDLGFYQLQKSAWIYPYPCQQEIKFVTDFYGVGKYIQILEINKFLSDVKLKG